MARRAGDAWHRDNGDARPVILLAWNRDWAEVWPRRTYEATRRRIERTGKPVADRWNVGRHTAIAADSICFLVAQGTREPRGVIAMGELTSEPFAGEHWSRPGHRTNYVDLVWRELLPFDEPIPMDELRIAAPDGPWMTGIRQSGRHLSERAAAQLLDFWHAD